MLSNTLDTNNNCSLGTVLKTTRQSLLFLMVAAILVLHINELAAMKKTEQPYQQQHDSAITTESSEEDDKKIITTKTMINDEGKRNHNFYNDEVQSGKGVDIINSAAFFLLRKEPTAGRLGNKMFEWASTLGLAHRNNLKPCMKDGWGAKSMWLRTFKKEFPECPPIKKTKEDGTTPTIKTWNEHEQFAKFQTKFKRDLNDEESDIQLNGYLQSFKYFDDLARDVIINEFEFTDEIQKESNKFLRHYENKIKVGIHVRFNDAFFSMPMTWENTNKPQFVPPGNHYYVQIMSLIRHKYGPGVIFFVASKPEISNMLKKEKVFQENDVIFISEVLEDDDPDDNDPDESNEYFSSAGLELSILVNCDHIITSIGSFGWWAAYLGAHQRGGDVYYFDKQFNMNHEANINSVSALDYYPLNWIAMSDDGNAT